MKLVAKHISLLKELDKGQADNLIAEAYSQGDYEAVKHLEAFKQTKSPHYLEAFLLDCCGVKQDELFAYWNAVRNSYIDARPLFWK